MKYIVLTILILLSSGGSFAQSKTLISNNGFMGSVGLNFSFPVTKNVFPPNADILGPTFFIAAGFVLNNFTAVRSELNYTHFADFFTKSDSSKLTGSFNNFAVKGELMVGTFRKNAFIDVYGITGLGYYSFSQSKDGDIKLEKDEDNLGIIVGAGINYRLYKNLSISWEAEYNALLSNSSLKGYFNLSTLNLTLIP